MPTIKEKKHMEVKTYDVDGIQVRVKINYDARQISLIDETGNPKQWTFKTRGPEYMEGWNNILRAMLSAIESSRVLLKHHIDQEEKEKAAKMKALEKAIREEK